jgi:hypothetical protein
LEKYRNSKWDKRQERSGNCWIDWYNYFRSFLVYVPTFKLRQKY